MKNKIKLKYLPTIGASIAYLLFLAGMLLLFFGRKTSRLWLPGTDAEFYSHISNLSISGLIVGAIGYFWLMMGVGSRVIFLLFIAVLAANFIYELFIPVLNTPDIVDAWFGAVGAGMGFAFLLVIRKWGMNINRQT